jgi:hypothetical protein
MPVQSVGVSFAAMNSKPWGRKGSVVYTRNEAVLKTDDSESGTRHPEIHILRSTRLEE